MEKTFISVDENRSRTYVADAFVSENDCFVGCVLCNGQISRLGALAESCDAYEEVVHGLLIVNRKEYKVFIEVSCIFTGFVQKCKTIKKLSLFFSCNYCYTYYQLSYSQIHSISERKRSGLIIVDNQSLKFD